MASLKNQDSQIAQLIDLETKRQRETLQMIASENHCMGHASFVREYFHRHSSRLRMAGRILLLIVAPPAKCSGASLCRFHPFGRRDCGLLPAAELMRCS